jgi:hypothetical protein
MIDETPGGIEDIGNRGARHYMVTGPFVAALCKHAKGSLGVVNLLARSAPAQWLRRCRCLPRLSGLSGFEYLACCFFVCTQPLRIGSEEVRPAGVSR